MNDSLYRKTSLSPMPSSGLLDAHCPFSPVQGCAEIVVRRSHSVFALWEAWEKEAGQECPVPFWAVVWPAARVLARLLLDEPERVNGKDVIEIGCGGAVASIAACKAGARSVTANDIDPVALSVARENAARNRVEILLDGKNRLVQTAWPDRSELVLCSDFFYMRSVSRTLADLMSRWREQGTTILIGDGGRAFAPASYREVLREEEVDVDPELEGREKRTVRILRF